LSEIPSVISVLIPGITLLGSDIPLPG